MSKDQHDPVKQEIERINHILWCFNAGEVSSDPRTADLMQELIVALVELEERLKGLSAPEHLLRTSSNITYMAGDACTFLLAGNFSCETDSEVEHVLTVTSELLEEVSTHLDRSERLHSGKLA